MKFNATGYSDQQLTSFYKELLLPRMIEEKMLLLLRKGQVSKWFAGIGQEAIAVGATLALQEDEYIMPLHRNLGVFTSRRIPLKKLFAQWQGKKTGFTKGRDRSFHFGTTEHHIAGMISHLGPQLSLASGVALAHKLDNQQKVSLAFTGEGGSSEGEFHEALNTAAVWKLPVIFLIENNGYGLSTPSSEQFACERMSDKAIGYGMRGITIDGNNILEVHRTISKLAEEIRQNPEPVLVECVTFRMRGHEEASGVKYVPKELFTQWEKKDPLKNYEAFLLKKGLIDEATIDNLRKEIADHIDSELKLASNDPGPDVNTEEELGDIFRNHEPEKSGSHAEYLVQPTSGETKEIRLVDACKDALHAAMKKWDNLVIMGQDVAEYGGVFKVTEGFVEEFGKDRVRNTTLCESAILGIGLGLSLKGKKAVVEMQFADFVTCGFNQIVNNLAKIHYRWGQNADVVVRMPTGAGVGAGPFHSQSNEAWFFHTPGLKVVYPSNPHDAKGLLLASIEDPNPVMFFEHKALYRSISGNVPEDDYTLPIGKGLRVNEGQDISVITYGYGVHWALDFANKNPNIGIDIIDLRTLLPWDKDLVLSSVKKTGKVIVLHEDTLTGGIGAEIASYVGEFAFEYLDGPVIRVGSLDSPVPFVSTLENNFLPVQRFSEAVNRLIEY